MTSGLLGKVKGIKQDRGLKGMYFAKEDRDDNEYQGQREWGKDRSRGGKSRIEAVPLELCEGPPYKVKLKCLQKKQNLW